MSVLDYNSNKEILQILLIFNTSSHSYDSIDIQIGFHYTFYIER